MQARTDRERLLQEAREANRLKDEFLATLSHELRTPLNAILGWSHLLQASGDEALMRHGLHAISRNAAALARLVEDILDVSRIVSGRMSLELRPIDLSPVLKTAIDSVRPAAEAKGLTLECAIDRRVRVNADASRLQQIFWNLLSNAVKFTTAGRIDVRIETDPGEARVVIEDTGIGIDPQFLPSVFDRFSQADGSSTRHYGGLGLGLAIVRHLTELHGGRAEATSAGVGQGARFTIALPRADRSQLTSRQGTRRATARGADAAPREELDGLRILVVDDDADELDLLHAILQAKGAEVTTAASAAGFHQHVAKPVSPSELTGVVASLVRNTRPAGRA